MWPKLFAKTKTPEDHVKSLRDHITESVGAVDDKAKRKAQDGISAAVLAVKVMLYGDSSNDVEVKPSEVRMLIRMACEKDLLHLMMGNLQLMEFETRKDAVQIVNNLLRREAEQGDRICAADRVGEGNGELLTRLMEGYDNGDIALNCGSILRECIRHERLTGMLFETGLFWKFFDLVEVDDFDVASDAFSTFKDTLTRHMSLSARYIETNMDAFVVKYNKLLSSDNYVTKRQSLKLLGEMLLERTNFKIMTRYIASATNLRLIMTRLLEQSEHIKFEAFHVFKIFVANPNKSPEVQSILSRNKKKMYQLFTDFLVNRDDDQFQEDRQQVIEEIMKLPGEVVMDEASKG